jgi:uncharacterized protein (TIGR04222 family)
MNPFDLPGPVFLGFYAVFAWVVVMVAMFVRRRILEPGGDGAAPDPYDLALLANEPEDVVRTAVIALLDRGALLPGPGGKGKPRLSLREGATPSHVRSPVERAVVEAAGRGASPEDLSKDAAVLGALASVDAALRRRRLLADGGVRMRRGVLLGVVLAVLLGVAGAKIMIGISRQRPITFLVVLTGVAALAAAVTSGLWNRRTAAGDRMLDDVRSFLRSARGRLERRGRSEGEPEVLLCSAAWGSDSLPATLLLPWSEALPPAPRKFATFRDSGPSASYASCGATSFSSSCSTSSCGSSSCGGGGGGGCGGCGS